MGAFTSVAVALAIAGAVPMQMPIPEGRFPIGGLRMCVDPLTASKVQLHGVEYAAGKAATLDQLTEDSDAITKCLDDRLKPAIAAAADNADLKDAIKALYLAQQDWVKATVPPSRSIGLYQAILREKGQAIEQADERVRMEMKLAGIEEK